MVTHYGITLPGVHSPRHPGDLRWPARHVALALMLYLALAWSALSLIVMLLV
ncbi:hypothetical protein ABIE65_005008 [Constrictibacter sp. MBR-5]|jgi:hypothetical protein|uniref:hypothetical protein n=1 Tax=Constrictibacter sp. MBR-5 TaxID=3156467 RepID=UPI0033908A1C